MSTNEPMHAPPQYPRPPQHYGYGPPQYVIVTNTVPPMNGVAIASLVCGIVWIFGLLSLPAIFFGIHALGRIKQTGERGRSAAVWGISLGIFGLLPWLLFLFSFGVEAVSS